MQPVLNKYDLVLSRHVGLSDVVDYKWRSLFDLSEKDQMELVTAKVEALGAALDRSVITEDEMRRLLADEGEVFGPLEGDAPEIELPDIDVPIEEPDDDPAADRA